MYFGPRTRPHIISSPIQMHPATYSDEVGKSCTLQMNQPWKELFSTSSVGCRWLFTAISFKGIRQFILSMAAMYYQEKVLLVLSHNQRLPVQHIPSKPESHERKRKKEETKKNRKGGNRTLNSVTVRVTDGYGGYRTPQQAKNKARKSKTTINSTNPDPGFHPPYMPKSHCNDATPVITLPESPMSKRYSRGRTSHHVCGCTSGFNASTPVCITAALDVFLRHVVKTSMPPAA